MQKWFSNRDYVFNRRYFIDRNRKIIIIVNRSTRHPQCPKKPCNQRVLDYWSSMVIRSTSNSFKTPGLEYTLTYFDNPGIVLPQTVTSWVAHKQMPEFLNKLYLATLEYAKNRKQEEIAIEKVKLFFVCFDCNRIQIYLQTKLFLVFFIYRNVRDLLYQIQAMNIHQSQKSNLDAFEAMEVIPMRMMKTTMMIMI